MRYSVMTLRALGLMTVFWMLGSTDALAESNLASRVDAALSKKNLSEIQFILRRDPSSVDEVVKGLLRATQNRLTLDPEFSIKMMALAGQHAYQITPPTVPVVCADLRRIVEAIPERQKGMPLHTTIVNAAQNFASAPVVVAAGRPNLCEDAWLQASNSPGDVLLFQNPGMRSPGLPPVTIGPGKPVGKLSPDEKPSAD